MQTQIQSIYINRVEGSFVGLGRTITVGSFEEADTFLRGHAHTAPQGRAYDKTDFTVTFDDGYEYSGTYDLHRLEVEAPDLRRHMVQFLEFTAGYTAPYWMDEETYDAIMRDYESRGIAPQSREILDTYAIKEG